MDTEAFEHRKIELPLAKVVCDRTVSDMLVVEDDGKVVLGRPHLIGLRDRFTGSIIGVSIEFEEPGRVARDPDAAKQDVE